METNAPKTQKDDTYKGTALMRKTKTQLIDIILRKDDIERQLCTKIKENSNNLEYLGNKINELKTDYEELNRDYEDICDEKVTEVCRLTSELKSKDNALCVISVLFLISVILNLILYLF